MHQLNLIPFIQHPAYSIHYYYLVGFHQWDQVGLFRISGRADLQFGLIWKISLVGKCIRGHQHRVLPDSLPMRASYDSQIENSIYGAMLFLIVHSFNHLF